LPQPDEMFETEMDGKPMYTRIANTRHDPPAGMNGTSPQGHEINW
jgi:hypothetical protein